MNRTSQLVMWIALGPIVGLVQRAASFVPILIQHPSRRADLDDISRLALGALLYGACWFSSAALLADWLSLRRSPSRSEVFRCLGFAAGLAAIIGIATPGYLIMIGVPITAVGILFIGFMNRAKAV